jgi:probable addiction module antidote protein
MSKPISKIKLTDLPVFDMAEHLQTPDDIANYLSIVMDDGDPALFVAALGDIAKARGMSQLAKDSGLAREALYKALRPNSHPRFDTISRVCAALGVRLQAHPQPVGA